MAQHQRRAVHLLVGALEGSPSGPFRFQIAASRQLLRCAAQVRKKPRYKAARNAIMDCVTNTDLQSILDGEVGDRNCDVLTVLACGAVLSAKVNTETIRETIARLVGKNAKDLYGLPGQIEKTAADVDRLNQDSWLTPQNQIDPNAPSAELTKQLYKNLPDFMRGWAKALTLRLSYMERQSAAMLCRGWTSQDYLQWLVEVACRGEYDRLVADLLQAAGVALGQPESETSKFNEGALAKRRERRRQREKGRT